MNKKREKYYKLLFFASGLYDLFLGIGFMIFYKPIFSFLKIEPPNPSYIILLGSFVFVLGIAYFFIYAGNLRKNRDLIKVGTIYKFVYALVATYTFIVGIIPHTIFFWVFGIIDLIFGFLFLECLKSIKKN